MFQSFRSDRYSWILLIGILALVVQSVFGDWGFLFPAAFFAFLFYYGKKKFHKASGKWLFFIGLIGLAVVLLSTFVFKIVILAAFIIFIIEFIQSKRRPAFIHPDQFSGQSRQENGVKTGRPLMGNRWFGYQETPQEDYEWQDINLQTGAGDVLIDLSRTILPEREAVIVIRHLAGRVRILVPYGIETSVRYSVVFGELDFFGHRESRLIHEAIAFQTENYSEQDQKLAIIVSAVAGHLEVRRT